MPGEVEIGIVAADGVSRELADDLAETLPGVLAKRSNHTEWRTTVRQADPAEPSAESAELLDSVRRRLLEGGWEVGLGLTELPLRSNGQPVTAEANSQMGVGLISVPALGGRNVDERLCRAAVAVVDGLAGGDGGVRDLASPLADARAHNDGSVRFMTAALRGNLRLLAGTVRANQPSRVVTRLSRALAGALGTGAFALASSNVWSLADGTSWPRLVGLALLSIVMTVVALILTHHLWERADHPRARERVVVFNIATVITMAMGVAILYLGLLALTVLGGIALIPPDVFKQQVGHGAGMPDYLQLAFLVATLATIGGALGSLVESDLSVRSAAQRSTEAAEDQDEAEHGGRN